MMLSNENTYIFWHILENTTYNETTRILHIEDTISLDIQLLWISITWERVGVANKVILEAEITIIIQFTTSKRTKLMIVIFIVKSFILNSKHHHDNNIMEGIDLKLNHLLDVIKIRILILLNPIAAFMMGLYASKGCASKLTVEGDHISLPLNLSPGAQKVIWNVEFYNY